jgi:hypothetical protein
VSDRRRGGVVGPVLAVLLVLGVAALVIIPRVTGGGSKHPSGPTSVTTVRVLAGSETAAYLGDSQVAARLAVLGYKLQVDTAGSQDMVSRDLKAAGGYDIALPSDATEAQEIKTRYGVTQQPYVPFSTPMAIATFQSIETILTANGLATTSSGVTLFDMAKYLDLVAKTTRWPDLQKNTNPTNKQVLISSTDVRTSNSAALYLAIASYVANGDNIVTVPGKAAALGDQLAPLFINQGFVSSTSQGPFDEYLTTGIGATPMVMIYESQFRAEQIQGQVKPEMQLMYPSPTIYARHSVVPLTAAGDAVGRLLTTDQPLQKLAAQYGFRTADPKAMSAASIPAPPDLGDVIDPPSEEISQAMITRISSRYTG